jgi:Asp-tRNA(Asn)/Glu-tRNA(Gln) amidotransferase C subunit
VAEAILREERVSHTPISKGTLVEVAEKLGRLSLPSSELEQLANELALLMADVDALDQVDVAESGPDAPVDRPPL